MAVHHRIIAHAPDVPVPHTWFGDFLDGLSKAGSAGGAVLAAVVAISLFILTRVTEAAASYIVNRANRRRMLIGIYAEAASAQKSIREFLSAQPHPHTIMNAVRADRNLRPIVISAQETEFFKASIGSLADIKSECLLTLLKYYEALNEVRVISKAFEGAAYPTLSDDARVGIVENFWRSVREAERHGIQALAALELNYPRKWFASLRP